MLSKHILHTLTVPLCLETGSILISLSVSPGTASKVLNEYLAGLGLKAYLVPWFLMELRFYPQRGTNLSSRRPKRGESSSDITIRSS